MEIVACVHVATEEGSPGAGGLWRWAVHVGRDFTDPLSCLLAGAEPDRVSAEIRGQEVAVACARVAERCGQLELTGETTTVVLDADPCVKPWPLLRFEEDY